MERNVPIVRPLEGFLVYKIILTKTLRVKCFSVLELCETVCHEKEALKVILNVLPRVG